MNSGPRTHSYFIRNVAFVRMEPERVADTTCEVGEGPLWHPDEERLYWVDIPNGRLYRYDPAADTHEEVYRTDVIGGFTIQDDGGLLLFEDGGRIETWDDGEAETIVAGVEREADSRFNDVITDPRGGVFCGTMPTDDRLGRLYRLDTQGTLIEVRDGLDVPNGMGFTPDQEEFYFTDTGGRTIYACEYDETDGTLGEMRPFVRVPDEEGEEMPDGMTVDAEGGVWSARWGGGDLVRYAPGGTETRRIELPARKVSSATFGGPGYDELYVTTAGGDDRESEGDGAGALFRLDPDVGGVAEFRSNVDG